MSEMVKLPGHHHPLLKNIYFEDRKFCFECDSRLRRSNYYCKICDEAWHKECMPAISEIIHPCHSHHALKLLIDGAPHYTDGKCHFCRQDFKNVMYHCSTCNFTLDMKCVISPKCATIDESKCHNHPLTLMARQVSFVCNVCGTHGERNPYVCLTCSFMVHEDCINRPHVININRHDHRISHTYSLVFGDRKCRVCRMNVDWMYGAYSCPKCPDFVVHSKCATREDVWDGEELEGVPEEEEDEPMFKVIGEGVINHVMHQSHNLRLTEDGVVRDEWVRCQLCEGSVYSDKLYICMECDYILHETCAHISHKKRHGLHRSRISLRKGVDGQFIRCKACKQLSSGYNYMFLPDVEWEIDLRCASVDWSCDHECHPHTLFLTNLDSDTCGACNSIERVLRCVDCKFNLCYKCATYPKKIKHRCDDHPLVLSFGDKEQHGTYWCTVCEAKIDPQKWFYECEGCGIVCHIQCVLGDFAYVKPELLTTKDGTKHGVIRNNGVTRQQCSYCATRCLVPFIYNASHGYFCSLACLIPDLEALEAKRYRQKQKQLQEKIRVEFYVQSAALDFMDASSSYED